jgi:hypothetical protein
MIRTKTGKKIPCCMNKSLTIAVLFLVACYSGVYSQKFVFDFQDNALGWTGDFADYPAGDSVFYELKFGWSQLPLPLDTARHALMISGNNHSDDLFMFIRKKISGLTPNKLYNIRIDIEMASEAPTNAMGIGGAPGESVFLKAGATIVEPRKVLTDGFFLMNIDKANQAGRGADMDTLGHIGVSDTTTTFTLINRSNRDHPFTLLTDDSGEVWICIGTDSGFEGTTTLYYSTIEITFDNATSIPQPENQPGLTLFPNPAGDVLHFSLMNEKIRSAEILGMDGTLINFYRNPSFLNISHLRSGTYILRCTTGKGVYLNRFLKK